MTRAWEPLFLDISRLLWRARRRTPSGIDRVELAYAKHYLASPQARKTYAVLHLFGMLFVINRRGAIQFIDGLSARWEGDIPLRHRPSQSAWPLYVRLIGHLFVGIYPLLFRRIVGPTQALFIVVSHHHVASRPAIRRLSRSYGMKTVCFVHDVLALDFPEYFPAWWKRWFTGILNNSRDSFAGIIVNSQCTARSLLRHRPLASRHDGRPTRVAPIGTKVFSGTGVAMDRPHFVMLGTIEPRKNPLLLLNLWARLAQSETAPPYLHLIGARGWENEQILDMLDRCPRLRGLVIEHKAADDATVAHYLKSAAALLLPSFAEGYGMPLAEALAVGIPVICSDIPVFHEVGGAVPEFLDPLDTFAWSDMILEYSRPHSLRRQAQLSRLTHWHAPTWDTHFAIVDELLVHLETGQDSSEATRDEESEKSLVATVARKV